MASMTDTVAKSSKERVGDSQGATAQSGEENKSGGTHLEAKEEAKSTVEMSVSPCRSSVNGREDPSGSEGESFGEREEEEVADSRVECVHEDGGGGKRLKPLGGSPVRSDDHEG